MNLYSSTIAAISTAMSPSGIGIVRMTGDDAFFIADQVYRGKAGKKLCDQHSHTIHYGCITDGKDIIDEVLVMLMRAPHSYTGEDTVEINCHGGIYVVKRILELLIYHGARLAEPGEFTRRAFLNGRMDLSQAEAVGDLIASQNELALKSSISQLKGSIKKKINDIRNKIIYEVAFIESALDDPEHVDLSGYGDKLNMVVENLSAEISYLLSTYEDGRMIKEGIKTVITGKPNVGKSSLLNALLGEERAIVTDIAGTTRDALEEYINIQGISLNIIDTAGIRDTIDLIEKMGVDKAKKYVKEADLIIYMADASLPLDLNDKKILDMIQGKNTIILLNKSDLARAVTKEEMKELFPSFPVIEMSVKEKQGIKELCDTIKDMFFAGNLSFNDKIYITNVRHKTALGEAEKSLEKVKKSIEEGMPEDFYSIDLMDAYQALGNITGEAVGEDLIHEIFSKFCMGK